ncbi:hypothetical protein LJC49_05710 [Ruminococcaceae bacterium OttesenSCG-928-I18]|nr:hypothetical protein [Ruminococcaceae bacterium OttesenSCG-928-I18]
MQASALIFDIVCLVIIILCALFFARKGILAGLLSLLGTVISIAVASLGSRALALPVFDRFFRPGLEESLENAFAEQNALATDMMLEEMSNFLPGPAQEALLASIGSADLNMENLAEKIVTEMVQPIVLPVITLVLFVILFFMLRVIIAILLHVLQAARGLPFVGTAQKAMGAVAGVFIGALYVFILVTVLEVVGTLMTPSEASEGLIANSLFYNVFSNINFITF